MRNLRLTVEYDGTGLSGWQRQDNAPTVQGHLEDVLATILEAPTTVLGASRTDAGVHALGQVASFRTEKNIPLHNFRRGINGMLPPQIAVRTVEEADDEFHPRFSATGKHYRYLVVARPERSPRWRTVAWWRRPVLDRAAMDAAAAALVGEHDFGGFRSIDCTSRTTVRRIDQVAVTEVEPGLLAIDVRGNAFLRNMVRIVAGTLVDVGEGRIPASQIPEILASRDRTRAGQTAPAFGLTLMEVRYEGRRVSWRPQGR